MAGGGRLYNKGGAGSASGVCRTSARYQTPKILNDPYKESPESKGTQMDEAEQELRRALAALDRARYRSDDRYPMHVADVARAKAEVLRAVHRYYTANWSSQVG